MAALAPQPKMNLGTMVPRAAIFQGPPAILTKPESFPLDIGVASSRLIPYLTSRQIFQWKFPKCDMGMYFPQKQEHEGAGHGLTVILRVWKRQSGLAKEG